MLENGRLAYGESAAIPCAKFVLKLKLKLKLKTNSNLNLKSNLKFQN